MKFILVSRLHGVDMFPRIGKNMLADITSNPAETPVYDHRDNERQKIAYWSAVLKRQFEVRPCAS